jgi:hypothetical protein
MSFSIAAKDYPETLIKYLSRRIITKAAEPDSRPKRKLHPILECDRGSTVE